MTADDRQVVASVIVSALRDARRSKRWLSMHSGIAYSTLRRKLDGLADISVTDLARIAQALDRSPASLLPPFEPRTEPASASAPASAREASPAP